MTVDSEIAAAGSAPATPRPPWIVWAGLAVVLAAAAVLSFDGLYGLALTVEIASHLAWLLPICVDAGAAVSCAVWLGGRSRRDAARYAGRMTMVLLAVTVASNAGHLGMVAEQVDPPWWVAVLVGAIPPAVVGSTVHLVVLLTRSARTDATAMIPVTAEPPAATQDRMAADEVWPDPQAADEREADPIADLVAVGAGRRRLARELGVTEYRARQLIAQRNNGHRGGES
ncbi:DUF2637 domain-containing protein [Pseudonocardia sp. CA-107938]|uniref:DUF2637 domain-containing protein n=1 Tax=Pseudonocardia sp. CA-107938 TaxID=3240021 RepID=UPI003D92E105